MIRDRDTYIVRKNRKRALGSLVIVGFMIPVSGWLLYAGLQPGRPDISWALVLFGVVGCIAFAMSALAIVRTMRSPWNLELGPSDLTLRTPGYDLRIPWHHVAGIAVDVVNQRPGCVIVLDDVEAVSHGATFLPGSNRRDAVVDRAVMCTRLEDNFRQAGYHLGIPGRMLELSPERLAELLVQARTGSLWKDGESDHETALGAS